MDGFEWDDANLAHIAIHDVTVAEVEEIICGVAMELEAQYEDGEERFPLIGGNSAWKNIVCGLYRAGRSDEASHCLSTWRISA